MLKFSIRSTPLLLAASSGALAAVKCLIDLGGYILRIDAQGNNVIHLAALRFHINILEFFILWDHRDVPVWVILVGKTFTMFLGKFALALIKFVPLIECGGPLINILFFSRCMTVLFSFV